MRTPTPRTNAEVTLATCEALLASGNKPTRDHYAALTIAASAAQIDWSRYPLTQSWFSQIG